jgi:hypothetical protein
MRADARAGTALALAGVLLLIVLCGNVSAQQRPLTTEDPEPIGAGRLMIEGGVEQARDVEFPVSGLEGHLWRFPTLGVSIGISSIAEFQIDGGLINRLSIQHRREGPLSDLLNITGDHTSDAEDLVIATKIRWLSERPGRPAFAFRFATRLPNSSNESGLGLDTTDFYASLIAGKTLRSTRLVGNVGVGILGDPTVGHRQNDVLTYGGSIARALTDRAEIVAEVVGRTSFRDGGPFPGTESRGRVVAGARYTWSTLRVDAGVLVGLTTIDPTVGFTAGFTYVFDAFEVP